MEDVKRLMAEAAAAARPQIAAAATAAAHAASRAMFGPAPPGVMPHPTGPSSSAAPGGDVMNAERLRMEQDRRRAAHEQSKQQAQAKANEEADDFVATTAVRNPSYSPVLG